MNSLFLFCGHFHPNHIQFIGLILLINLFVSAIIKFKFL